MITVNGEPFLRDGEFNRKIVAIVEGAPMATTRKYHDVPQWSSSATRHRMTCTEWRLWRVLPDTRPGMAPKVAADAAGYTKGPSAGAPNHVYLALGRMAERGWICHRKVKGPHGMEYRFWRNLHGSGLG